MDKALVLHARSSRLPGAFLAFGSRFDHFKPMPVREKAVEFAGRRLDTMILRGHTPGSVALAYDDPQGHTHLFTGDSLFPVGVGNTKMEGQSFDSLYRDVTERIFDVYGDDTWFYPGHGADSTLGAERPHLDEWRERGW